MKLSEPLTGIKLIQGHWVMHVTLFVVSFLTVDTSQYYPGSESKFFKDRDFQTGPPSEIQIFNYLTYGHLATALLQTIKWLAEIAGWVQLANSIQLTTLFTYLAPLFLSQWCLQNISTEILQKTNQGKIVDLDWTPVREWLLFE